MDGCLTVLHRDFSVPILMDPRQVRANTGVHTGPRSTAGSPGHNANLKLSIFGVIEEHWTAAVTLQQMSTKIVQMDDVTLPICSLISITWHASIPGVNAQIIPALMSGIAKNKG